MGWYQHCGPAAGRLAAPGTLAGSWLSQRSWFPVKPAESAAWCDSVPERHLLTSAVAAALQPCGKCVLGVLGQALWVLRTTGDPHAVGFLSSASPLPELLGGVYRPRFPASKVS